MFRITTVIDADHLASFRPTSWLNPQPGFEPQKWAAAHGAAVWEIRRVFQELVDWYHEERLARLDGGDAGLSDADQRLFQELDGWRTDARAFEREPGDLARRLEAIATGKEEVGIDILLDLVHVSDGGTVLDPAVARLAEVILGKEKAQERAEMLRSYRQTA